MDDIGLKTRSIKDQFVIGLALFSMFFGAGNVIFPPYLGMEAGNMWLPAFVCYYAADIGLALLALFAMMRVGQGIEGVTQRVGRIPSLIICSVVVLCTGPLIAVPRTAATTYEMLVMPLTDAVHPVVFACLFFALIFLLCVKESSVVDIVGKFLTPVLFIGLMLVIIKGIIDPVGGVFSDPRADNIIAEGISAGYQTMDVLGAMLFGVIIFKTAGEKGYVKKREQSRVIGYAGIIAGICLLAVYGGLAYLGATSSSLYGWDITRSELVLDLVTRLWGSNGTLLFGIVVALACITTAVALVSSAASYFADLSKGRVRYDVLVAIICIFSAIVSNMGLDQIIAVASPILNVVYAPSVALIVLTLFGSQVKNDNVFRGVALGALVVSLLETAAAYIPIFEFVHLLPLSALGFAWVVPAIICGVIGYFIPAPDKSLENR